MKKIKLFALAVMAMLSTNAFAAMDKDGASGLFKIKYDAANMEAKIVGFQDDVVATNAGIIDLVIPSTLSNSGGDPFKVVEVGPLTATASLLKAIKTITIEDANVAIIDPSAFTGATALTSVTVGKAVTTIGASAFAGCTALETLNLASAEKLAIIGNYAFGGAKIATLDFSKCAAMLHFTEDGTAAGTATTPFIASGATNDITTKVVLHANTVTIGKAFSKMTILDDINISGTKIEAIGADAFNGDVSLAAITFPETIKSIGKTAGDKPFVGCVRLATLEIPAKALTQVGDGTNNLFGTNDLDLNALKTLKITGDVTGTCALKTKAFSTCTALKTVEIAKGKTIDGTKCEAAFATVCDGATVTIGEIKTGEFGADDFLAVATDKAATLTIEKISVDLTNEIISGKVAVTVSGAIANAVNLDALGSGATSLTFGGDISTAFVAYAAYGGNLESINFGAVKLQADQLPSDMFGYGGTTYAHAKALTVTWQPADGDKKAFINKQAFAYATVAEANRKVTLSVTQAVAALYDYSEDKLFDVKEFGAEPDSENKEITPANGVEGATTFFAKWYNKTTRYKISKENGTATVKVYEGYVDDDDATIYMLPMVAINGYFYVPANDAVVVKSTSTDPITVETLTATEAADASNNSANYAYFKSTAGDQEPAKKNQIWCETTAKTGAAIMIDLSKTYYAMAKPEKYGLSWKTFKTSAQMPANTFLITTKESSASRLNVVWLDEDATAIQSFKAKVEAGQIYNLRGEKVNASYKGIVIKDGKKYIQK